MPEICQCEIPNVYESLKGDKGNVCKDCGGKVPAPRTDPRREIGSLLIRVQGVMGELDFRDDKEQAEFAAHMNATLQESWRQGLLTWRANRMRPRAA